MVRVVLPAHLRTLARVSGDEVQVQLNGCPTLGAVLDAIEATYPVLRGAIRDHVTEKRRPFVRFFACEQDLSHELPNTPLPDAVVPPASMLHWLLDSVPATPTVAGPVKSVPASFTSDSRWAAWSNRK